ncbi:hypothetical protein AB0C96_32815 [Streptomyces sp. NPDC048506]
MHSSRIRTKGVHFDADKPGTVQATPASDTIDLEQKVKGVGVGVG